MVSIFYRSNPSGADAAKAQVAELYKMKDNLPYYTLIDFLIQMEFCANNNQVRNLQSIFQPEIQKDWDMDGGVPHNRQNPRDSKLRQPTTFSPYGNTSSPPNWRMREGQTGNGSTKPFDERDPNQSVCAFDSVCWLRSYEQPE